MTKRLLHCRCCGQLSPAEYNCCPKYHKALTELEELMKELTYKKGAYKDVYSGNATPNQFKADAIREMMKEVKYNKGSKSFSEARILKYIESLENQDG